VLGGEVVGCGVSAGRLAKCAPQSRTPPGKMAPCVHAADWPGSCQNAALAAGSDIARLRMLQQFSADLFLHFGVNARTA
jgi:hypothetical protein